MLASPSLPARTPIAIRPRIPALLWILAVVLRWNAAGQDIAGQVNPGGTIDFQNTSAGRWYFFDAPQPSAAKMYRVNSSGTAAYVWGTAGQFQADPGSLVQNRIFQGEYLRVECQGVGIGTTVVIPFSYTPAGQRYQFKIAVIDAPKVTAINIMDPSPTAAATVRWAVEFDQSIVAVGAANFGFANSAAIAGVSIASVTGSGKSWVVTANTGTGTGLLGLNWKGHASESPSVPAPFTGQLYDFSILPLFSAEPQSVFLLASQSATLSATAVVRGGGAVSYQWYSGSSATPQSAVAIGGATGPSYKTPAFGSLGSYPYFVRATSTPGTYRDSVTAVVRVVAPPSIGIHPSPVSLTAGQSTTLSVKANGTPPLHYRWFMGAKGDTSHPVGGDSPDFATGGLSANTLYWVEVANDAPSLNPVQSNQAKVSVGTGLFPLVTLARAPLGRRLSPDLLFVVLDSEGAPMPGLAITVTGPASGAHAQFPTGNSTSGSIQPDGYFHAPPAVATGDPGPYLFQAAAGTLTASVQAINLEASPRLEIGNSGDSVAVSWPVAARGYVLDTQLDGGPWIPILGSAEGTGVLLPRAAGNALYRLRFDLP